MTSERLGGRPDWNRRRLKYCVSLVDDKVDTVPEGSRYVGLENIESWTGQYLVKDGPEGAGEGVANQFNGGDILFGKLRPYLAKCLLPAWSGVCTSELLVLRPRVFDARYLQFLMLSRPWIELVNSSTYGAKMPRASWEFVGNVSVPVPPLKMQAAIADFLDREAARIGELIAKKERLIELLAASLDSFVSARTTDRAWGARPGSKSVRLRAITALLQTGPFGSQLHAEDYIEDGVPVINPSNIVDRSIIPDFRTAVSEATAARLSRHKLQLFDFVFARRGEMGRCGLVTADQAGWICGTGSLLVRLRTDRVDPRFLIEYLNTSYVAEYLQQFSVGSTMDNLNTNIIARLPIALPSLSVQAEVADEIDEKRRGIHNLRDTALRGVHMLTEYRTALISAAVTGKIDVRTYHKEPEAVLEAK